MSKRSELAIYAAVLFGIVLAAVMGSCCVKRAREAKINEIQTNSLRDLFGG